MERRSKMKELKVKVKKIVRRCGANHKVGDSFYVRGKGLLEVPEGGRVCLFALQSLMPILISKQREEYLRDEDWVKETKELCCPDPEGVIFEVETL